MAKEPAKVKPQSAKVRLPPHWTKAVILDRRVQQLDRWVRDLQRNGGVDAATRNTTRGMRPKHAFRVLKGSIPGHEKRAMKTLAKYQKRAETPSPRLQDATTPSPRAQVIATPATTPEVVATPAASSPVVTTPPASSPAAATPPATSPGVITPDTTPEEVATAAATSPAVSTPPASSAEAATTSRKRKRGAETQEREVGGEDVGLVESAELGGAELERPAKRQATLPAVVPERTRATSLTAEDQAVIHADLLRYHAQVVADADLLRNIEQVVADAMAVDTDLFRLDSSPSSNNDNSKGRSPDDNNLPDYEDSPSASPAMSAAAAAAATTTANNNSINVAASTPSPCRPAELQHVPYTPSPVWQQDIDINAPPAQADEQQVRRTRPASNKVLKRRKRGPKPEQPVPTVAVWPATFNGRPITPTGRRGLFPKVAWLPNELSERHTPRIIR